MKRHYTEAERMAGVALAATVGPLRASQELGIPMTTVAYWMHRPSSSPIIAAAEANIADRLEAAASIALEAVTEGLRDPKARLGDRARALEVLATQANLAAGRATAISSNVNLNISEYEAALADMSPVNLRAMVAEMVAYNGGNPVDHVIAALRCLTPEQRDELERRIEEAERPIGWHEEGGGGIYGMLPDGAEMYFSADDPRWRTGELVKRFDPLRLTDGQ
jgi:hypothetical protein